KGAGTAPFEHPPESVAPAKPALERDTSIARRTVNRRRPFVGHTGSGPSPALRIWKLPPSHPPWPWYTRKARTAPDGCRAGVSPSLVEDFVAPRRPSGNRRSSPSGHAP